MEFIFGKRWVTLFFAVDQGISYVYGVFTFKYLCVIEFHILICFKDGDFTLKHTGFVVS
jgi:hypothetical protein